MTWHSSRVALAALATTASCVGQTGSNSTNDGSSPFADAGGMVPAALGDAAADAERLDAATGPTDASSPVPVDGGTGTVHACDPGTTTTTWASDCPTQRRQCVAGTWTNPGSTEVNDPVVCESEHFAVHAPNGTITMQQCQDATHTLETVIWPTFFGPPILFPEPYCDTANKFKTSITIHTDWGLTGGPWGDGYLGMWIGPGATADHWGLAHEFTHAVQGTTKGLVCGGPTPEDNTCGWLWESHANWMPHQLPGYRDEVHCSEYLPNSANLYLGSTRDRYCNWQFMEFLKDKYCYSAVNDIWTAPTPNGDPFTNIARTRGFDTAQLNDFFGEWAMHNVTWDYRNLDGTDQGRVYREKYGSILDVSRPERRRRLTRLLPLDKDNHRYAVPAGQAPQRWGYNVVRLHPEAGADHVEVVFRGVVKEDTHPDWRWGLVATDAAMTQPRYSALQRGADSTLSFCVRPGDELFLVVTGAPSVQQSIYWDQYFPTIPRYPYMVELHGALPDGEQPNAPMPSANGRRWPNGGGWVDSAASVAEGAYVGPYAAVLAGTVGPTARIEDSAIILGATINSGTVGGVSVIPAGFTLGGSAVVNLSFPYGPGIFERPVSASGTAKLIGDLEYRGENTSKTRGTYCGGVGPDTPGDCTNPDVSPPEPFVWRP